MSFKINSNHFVFLYLFFRSRYIVLTSVHPNHYGEELNTAIFIGKEPNIVLNSSYMLHYKKSVRNYSMFS